MKRILFPKKCGGEFVPVFTKRVIQKIIDENSSFLSDDQIQRHVNALNRVDQETVDFEWEVVMLNAFSKIGNVVHEPDFGGASRVDLYFRYRDTQQAEFIADIATVSDRGIEKENRQKDFQNELNRLIRKYELNLDCFSWHIDGAVQGTYRNGRMKLKFPEKVNWPEVFDADFIKFLDDIKLSPGVPHRFARNSNSVGYSVEYSPNQRGQTGHFPAYTVAYSRTKNPVYNALKRKTDQLKKANYKGIYAIILCDGGCRLLNDVHRGVNNFNLDEVINYFLKNNSSISFVLTFATKEVQSPPMGQRKRQFQIIPRFYPNPSHNKTEQEMIFKLIELLPSYFPTPVTTANNAQLFIEHDGQKGISFEGGLTMSGKQIKMSSRALLELLSGQVDAAKFFETHHNFSFGGTENNLFKLRAMEGCMFQNMRIEKCEDRDDDWIIFEFGEPDPAISPFRVPRRS